MDKERKPSIIKGVFTVVFFLIGSKILSFIIEMLTAYSLGASTDSDIYYVIYSVYSILSPMISIGIWKVYMPSYKERLVLNKPDEAHDITNKLFLIFAYISIFIIAIINLIPRGVINVFAPGLSADSVIKGIPLLRIISSLFLVGIIHTFGSAILQANNRFEKSQLKGIIQHIPTLLYLIAFRQSISITGLTISIVVGEIVSAIVISFFTQPYYVFSLPGKLLDNEILRILKTLPSACAISIINQLHGIIDKAFASSLAVGSITCLNYGAKLCYFFDGIFSTAISTAVFPTLTELMVKNDKKKLEEFISKYLSILSFFIIGVTVYLACFSDNIVMVLFGRGEFSADAVKMTSGVLFMYSLGLLAMCFNTIVNDVFYISKRTNILLFTTVLNIILNIAFNFVFVRAFSVAGLALATTLSIYITMGIKLYYARETISINRNTYINVAMMVVNAFLCFIVVRLVASFFQNDYLKLFVGAVVLASAYVLVAVSCNKFYRNMIKESLHAVKSRVGIKQ